MTSQISNGVVRPLRELIAMARTELRETESGYDRLDNKSSEFARAMRFVRDTQRQILAVYESRLAEWISNENEHSELTARPERARVDEGE